MPREGPAHRRGGLAGGRFAEVRDEESLWGDLRPELLEAVKAILEASMEDGLTAQAMADG